MILYILPCVIGFLIKGYLLFTARQHRIGDNIFLGLIAVLAVHNLCELFGYLQFFQGEVSEIILRVYYALTVLSLAYISVYAIEVSRLASFKKLAIPIYGIALIFCVVFIVTDALVAGSTPTAYTVIAVKGEYYWAFRFFAIMGFMLIIASLVLGYLKSADSVQANQCLYALLALSPIILLGSLVLFLMTLGLHFSIAVIMPLCTAVFVIIIVRSESEHRMTDIRRLLPFSSERRAAQKLIQLYSSFSIYEKPYREVKEDCERALLLYTLERTGYNVSVSAKILDMKRSTLYSVCKRLDISIQGGRN